MEDVPHVREIVQPNIVRLDMALIRTIDSDRGRRAITKGIIQVCGDLSMQVIAEGIETGAEMEVLRDLGVEFFQGYYFARPAFRALAPSTTLITCAPSTRIISAGSMAMHRNCFRCRNRNAPDELLRWPAAPIGRWREPERQLQAGSFSGRPNSRTTCSPSTVPIPMRNEPKRSH